MIPSQYYIGEVFYSIGKRFTEAARKHGGYEDTLYEETLVGNGLLMPSNHKCKQQFYQNYED